VINTLITLAWPVIFSLSRRLQYRLRRKMMRHAIGQVYDCGAWFATVLVECVSEFICLSCGGEMVLRACWEIIYAEAPL
jgi:hypothetical protein